MKIYPLTALIAILIIPKLVFAECQYNDRICSGSISEIYRYQFYMEASKRYEFKVTGLSASADVVLHLINTATGAGVCTIDRGWNGSNGNEIMKIGQLVGDDCSIPQTGVYMFVARAFSTGSSGAALDFSVWSSDLGYWYSYGSIPVNGMVWLVELGPSDKIQTAPQKFQYNVDPLVFIQDTISSLIRSYNDDGGVGLHSRALSGTGGYFSSSYVIVGSYSSSSTGNVKVYRNEASEDFPSSMNCNIADDTDCDGLGNQLELELGSCPCIGLACNSANPPIVIPLGSSSCRHSNHINFNPKDSDGDGLPDFWEVLGRPSNPYYNGLTLPAYGVDLLHKDVLIEVDWVNNEANSALPLSEDVVKQWINTYESRNVGTALTLRNPDNLAGIRLHIDSAGLPNKTTSGGSTYGFRGGASSAPARTSQLLMAKQYMNHSRHGIFRYLILGEWGSSSVNGIIPNWKMQIKTSLQNPPAELSHTATIAHETGHVLGLLHWGKTQAGDKFNYKPNYPSIMNYAYESYYNSFSDYSKVQFSKGTLISLTPDNLDETQVLGTLNIYTSWLSMSPFFFDVSNGMVNWNRDHHSSGNAIYSSLAKAPILLNPALRGVPDGTNPLEYGLNKVAGGDTNSTDDYANANYPGILVEYDSKLYALYAGTKGTSPQFTAQELLSYRYYTQNNGWSSHVNIKITVNGNTENIKIKSSPASAAFNFSSSNRLVITYLRESDNKLYWGYLSTSGVFTEVGIIAEPDTETASAPALIKYNNKLYLFYRKRESDVLKLQEDENIYMKSMDNNGVWSAESRLRVHGSSTYLKSAITPALFVHPTENKLYGVFAKCDNTGDPNCSQFKNIFIAYWDESATNPTNQWKNIDLSTVFGSNTIPDLASGTRPSVVFDTGANHPKIPHLWLIRQTGQSQGLKINLHRWTPDKYDPGIIEFRVNRLIESGTPEAKTTGVSVVNFAGQFHVLYSVETTAASHIPDVLNHLPYADGIFPVQLNDWNDWSLMADNICLGIASRSFEVNSQNVQWGAGCGLCVAPNATCP